MRLFNLNYRIMLLSTGMGAFASQLLGPFFVLFIQQKGGSIENLGVLFGVSIIASSLTAYFFGRASDTLGRKPFLIGSSIAAAFLNVSYLYVQNLLQRYVLQIMSGITIALWDISESAFMGDITKKRSRGRQLGFYNMSIGILAAIGLMIGGFAIGKFGFPIIFWAGGILFLISGICLVWIKEK